MNVFMVDGRELLIAHKTIVTTATLTHTTPRLDHAYSNHESHGPNSESAERSLDAGNEKKAEEVRVLAVR